MAEPALVRMSGADQEAVKMMNCCITVTGACSGRIVQHVHVYSCTAFTSPPLQCRALSDELLTPSPMAQESIIITQSLSPRTPGSSIFSDGLSDGSVTRECYTDGKDANEVQNRGGSCTECP